MPLYGLTLDRGDNEDRSQLNTDEPVEVGYEFEHYGEQWVVTAIESSELGRVEAWLVCKPVGPPPQLH